MYGVSYVDLAEGGGDHAIFDHVGQYSIIQHNIQLNYYCFHGKKWMVFIINL